MAVALLFAIGTAAWLVALDILIQSEIAREHYLLLETAGIAAYAVLFCFALERWLTSRLSRQQLMQADLESNRYGIASGSSGFRVSFFIGLFFMFLVLTTNGLQYVFGDTQGLMSWAEIVKEIVLVGLATLFVYVQVRSAFIAQSNKPDAEVVRSWVPLIAFVLMTIGIGNTGYYLLQKYKNEIEQDNRRLLTTISTLMARQIVNWRTELLQDGEAVAGDSLLAQAVSDWSRASFAPGTRRDMIAERLASLRRAHGYLVVFLIDAAGAVRLSSGTDAVPPSEYALGLAREALRLRRVLLSDIHSNPDEKEPMPVIDILVPLLRPADSGRAEVGAVYIRVEAHRTLDMILGNWPPKFRSGETFLARREGSDIVYLNDLRYRPGSALYFRLPVSRSSLLATIASEGAEGIIEGVDYRDMPSIGAALSVPDTGWLLVSKVDKEELFESIDERARAIAALVILSVLGMGLALVLWWRQHHTLIRAQSYMHEQERKALTRRYEVLVQQASDSIILFNDRGQVLEANDRASAVYGYSKEELRSLSLDDLCQEESCAMRATGLCAENEEGILCEVVHCRKNGQLFPVEVSARRICTNVETVVQAIIRDISERKEAEREILQLNAELEAKVTARTAELEEANRELEAFSYSLSHDLRAPLRHLIGFSRILQGDCGGQLDDACRGHLERVVAAGERMDRLVESVLKLFQIGLCQGTEREPVDMSAMAREILAQLAMTHPGRRVICDVADSVTAIGDAALLRGALENLLGNAWKYTLKQKEARVQFGSRWLDNGQQAYFIRDNGAGFDMAYADELFMPFRRLHSANDFPGTGIGLASVQRIVRRHGGRIWAESRAGEGATFLFTLDGSPNAAERQSMTRSTAVKKP